MLHYVHKLENRNLARIIGIFIFSALGVLTVVLLSINKQHNPFSGSYNIHVVFNQGFGLKEGSTVDVAGVEVGTVESIQFNRENNITVTAGIQNKYKEMVRTDSMASIVSHGLMGNMGLSITVGSRSMPVVEDGEYVGGVSMSETNGMLSGINPIIMKANKAIDNIIYLTSVLDKPLARINNILKNLDEVSEEIRTGQGNIGALLRDKDLYSNVTKMVNSSQRLLASVEKAVINIEEASQLFPEVINKVELSMMEINKSTAKMPHLLAEGEKLIGNIQSSSNDFGKLIRDSNGQITRISEILEDFKDASTELPGLIRASQENMDEVTRIVEGAEKNWIIRGFLERQKKEEPIIVDVRAGHYNEIIR